MEIAERFYQQCDFPNGIDAIDGKYIVLEQPFNSGSLYRNYKGEGSIILLTMIGPEKEFLYVDVGANGRSSDVGVWIKCAFKNVLRRNTLNVPTPTVLAGRNIQVAYVCTGGDAFQLSTTMMKAYPKSSLTVKKQIFNYRLSRMKHISENGSGILTNRWFVFRRPFMLEPEKVKTLILTTITLHKWLREESKNRKIYIPKGLIDHENM